MTTTIQIILRIGVSVEEGSQTVLEIKLSFRVSWLSEQIESLTGILGQIIQLVRSFIVPVYILPTFRTEVTAEKRAIENVRFWG